MPEKCDFCCAACAASNERVRGCKSSSFPPGKCTRCGKLTVGRIELVYDLDSSVVKKKAE